MYLEDNKLSSYEILHQDSESSYKKKIALLGGTEKYKDKFQEYLSSNCLPTDNKPNIGVNISRIDYLFKNYQKFEFLLWNIDCRQRRTYLRSIFYNGTEAFIILISETKINQIIHYFNEIHNRMQSANIFFCIILENSTKDTLIDKQFKDEGLKALIESFNFRINNINEPSIIFKQISSQIMQKIKYKELDNVYVVNFIHRNLLFPQSSIRDECNDYFEPQTNDIRLSIKINTKKLIQFIKKLDLDIDLDNDWIKIRNERFGNFSIFLKNGNVYYFPGVCENCTKKKCPKLQKTPFFICIEANTESWTNINGFDQPELLVLSKIIALKEGNEKTLPISVLKQIYKFNECENKRKYK
jgi:hypothetical protein